jgi:hypothetical protein
VWPVELSAEQAGRYLRLAVAGARREYPNAPAHLLTGPADLLLPRAVHPAFYGCLDWHSAVHTHWLMARVCRLLPGAPGVGEARAVLAEHLTVPNLAAEAAYLADPPRAWFERPYGRAWALALAADLPPDDPRTRLAAEAARRHLDAALPHVTTGDFVGGHWLATFAVLALT